MCVDTSLVQLYDKASFHTLIIHRSVLSVFIHLKMGLKMSEKAANVQRKPFRNPGELLLKTTLKDYDKV